MAKSTFKLQNQAFRKVKPAQNARKTEKTYILEGRKSESMRGLGHTPQKRTHAKTGAPVKPLPGLETKRKPSEFTL